MTDAKTSAVETPIPSVALPGEGEKLIAPSAARNMEPICALLEQVAPQQGTALEIASGTGEHVVAFAQCLPGLNWQPSEPDALRRASIDAYVQEAKLPNLSLSVDLDATRLGWSQSLGGRDLIVLVNLLHLISMPAVRTLVSEGARALRPGGRFVIYGPFMRAGELTSDGDRAFHDSLSAQDPDIGYKDDFDVMDLLQGAGLDMRDVIEMPANNLALVAEKFGT